MPLPSRTGEEALRRDLAAAHRICYRLNFHEGIDGHMSVGLAGPRREMLLSSYPMHWSEVTASTLARVTLSDGTVVSGKFTLDRPAWCVHGSLQRSHPRHACFIHCHVPHVTAIACRNGGRIAPVHQHMVGLFNDIAYFDEYRGEVIDEDYGADIAATMGFRSVIILANHGVITGGARPALALKRLYYLERAAAFQILAQSSGGELREIAKEILLPSTEASDETTGGHADEWFAAWLRILDREEPEYAN